MISNYEKTKRQMQAVFAGEADSAAERFGLESDGSYVYLTFLGRECRISREDGMAEIRKSAGADYEEADFEIALSLYDMLSRTNARIVPSGCLVSMQQLATQMRAVTAPSNSGFYGGLAALFDHREEDLKNALRSIGAVPVPGADVSADVDVFRGLKLQFRFWCSDEEFAPQIQFFWDSCVLEHMHYETVWYVNGAFLDILREAFEARPTATFSS